MLALRILMNLNLLCIIENTVIDRIPGSLRNVAIAVPLKYLSNFCVNLFEKNEMI